MFNPGDKVVCVDASSPDPFIYTKPGQSLVKDALYIVDAGPMRRSNGEGVLLRGITHYWCRYHGDLPWNVNRFRKVQPPRSRSRERVRVLAPSSEKEWKQLFGMEE